MAKLHLCFTIFFVLVSQNIGPAQTPIIDGVFDDWTSVPQLASDPAGDNSGAFDVTTLSATSDGKSLFVRFDIGQAINIQNGAKEDGTLKLIISKGDESLTVDFRGRSTVDESGKRIGWNDLGFRCLPTFASDVYELKIDLSSLEVKAGDKVSLH